MKSLLAMALFLSTACVSHGGNLLKNPEFLSEGGRIPGGWAQAQNPSFPGAFRVANGELRISGKSPSYANMLSQKIDVEEGKSYYFEVDYKADSLASPGGVGYYLLDGQGKAVGHEFFMFRTRGPQPDWRKVSCVVSTMSEPGRIKSVRLFLVKYNRNEETDAAIFFRGPVFCEYNGQEIRNPPREDAAPVASSENIFSHNMTNSQKGVPYKLEKGRVGFLRMDTPRLRPKRGIRLVAQAPEGVSLEAYFSKGGKVGLIQPASVEDGKWSFDITREHDWQVWSNGVLFASGDGSPQKFELRVVLTDCDERREWSFTIPVEQVVSRRVHKKPLRSGFCSWQCFPLGRIDPAKCGPLALRLKEGWEDGGWRPLSFYNVAPLFSASHGGGKTGSLVPHGVDAAGAPVSLYCDSALVAGGTGLFLKLAGEDSKDKLRPYTHILWDYEPYCAGPVTLSCFCGLCLRNFSKEFGLPEGLTGRDVLRNHESQWVEFRCRQRAATIRTAASAARLLNPSAKFVLCSMPMPPKDDSEYFRKYGIDLRLADDSVDIHAPMNYERSLDYYRSLERDAVDLKRPRMTIISNGWGDVTTIEPSRLASQMLGAFFCDNQTPFIGQGLFIAQGDQLSAIREMMTDVAMTEDDWWPGRHDPDKSEVSPGFMSDNKLYAIARKASNGCKYLLLVNNDERDDAYAKVRFPEGRWLEVSELTRRLVMSPEKGQYAFRLAPLSYQIVELSPALKRGEWGRKSSKDVLSEESRVASESGKRYETMRVDGVVFGMSAAGYQVSTPAQTLVFNLKNAARAEWAVGGKTVVSEMGRESFMDRFQIENLPAKLESCRVAGGHVEAVFSYVLDKAPFDGLLVRKTFMAAKEEPVVSVKVEIVPESGFRQFRYRVTHVLAMGKELPSGEEYSSRIEYKIGDIKDDEGRTAIYVRPGARFPQNEPFFSKFAAGWRPFAGNSVEAVDKAGGASVVLESDNVDQLFLWRYQDCATIETIYPDAYPENDPHAVNVWRASYTLRHKGRPEPK